MGSAQGACALWAMQGTEATSSSSQDRAGKTKAWGGRVRWSEQSKELVMRRQRQVRCSEATGRSSLLGTVSGSGQQGGRGSSPMGEGVLYFRPGTVAISAWLYEVGYL
jgi:hypothetical protein